MSSTGGSVNSATLGGGGGGGRAVDAHVVDGRQQQVSTAGHLVSVAQRRVRVVCRHLLRCMCRHFLQLDAALSVGASEYGDGCTACCGGTDTVSRRHGHHQTAWVRWFVLCL
jgi:hypothetical protein